MTAEELIQRAKDFSEKNNVPITKNQFEGTVDDPVPPLPYMVYLTPHALHDKPYGKNTAFADWSRYGGHNQSAVPGHL